MKLRHYCKEMRRQKAAEADARTYKKDRSSLTMKERLEAKLKKEEMLARSFKPEGSASLEQELSEE